jgi:hypothetical protein
LGQPLPLLFEGRGAFARENLQGNVVGSRLEVPSDTFHDGRQRSSGDEVIHEALASPSARSSSL